MGSLCGKESPSSGGALNSTAASRASLLPSFRSKKPKVGGPGRTLGDSSGYGEIGDGSNNGEQSAPSDARVAAALAAEQRLNNSQKGGKLGSQLEQQKRKTQNQHLQDGSKSKGQQEQLVWD